MEEVGLNTSIPFITICVPVNFQTICGACLELCSAKITLTAFLTIFPLEKSYLFPQESAQLFMSEILCFIDADLQSS